MSIRAVFFDVDFTLIHPGPTFRGEGYEAFCRRHGMTVDRERFAGAVDSAAPLLDDSGSPAYDAEIFIAYTRHIIEQMGGSGEAVDRCAREIYAEWAGNHHFDLYEDVPPALTVLAAGGYRLGLISNSHRCLTSFQEHFDLRSLIAGAISSAEHGWMKPHRSIFDAALQKVGADPAESVMVGDSVNHDIEGALEAGLGAVFLHRGGRAHPREPELAARGVPTIGSLRQLPGALEALQRRRPHRTGHC